MWDAIRKPPLSYMYYCLVKRFHVLHRIGMNKFLVKVRFIL